MIHWVSPNLSCDSETCRLHRRFIGVDSAAEAESRVEVASRCNSNRVVQRYRRYLLVIIPILLILLFHICCSVIYYCFLSYYYYYYYYYYFKPS